MGNDLISREALLKKFLMPEKGTMEFSADVLDAIMEAPAVDARPVKHGKWIRQDDTFTRYKCSECGSENHKGYENFCLYCGAKMDEED